MSVAITKSRLCLLSEQKIYLLSTSVQSSLDSSGSFLLSLAEFLCSVGRLYPQSVIVEYQKQKKAQSKHSFQHLRSTQDYFEIWCDYIFDLLCEDSIMQINDEAVIFAPAGSSYLKYVLKTGYFVELPLLKNYENAKKFIAKEIYNCQWQPVPENKTKKVFIINMSASVRDPDKTAPKINLAGLYSGLFYRHGDRWKSFKILNNEIPTPEELTSADTVLLSGSSYSVNSMHQYIKLFVSNLMQALRLSKYLKVLGICFGHQLIAYSLGSIVEKRKRIKGLQYINLKRDSYGEIVYLKELLKYDNFKLKIYQFHSDYVTSIPEGFLCLGESKSCNYEMMMSEDKRVFSLQFHPQYTVEYIRALEKKWEKLDSNFKGIHQEKYEIDQEHHQSVKDIRKVVRNFIDWQNSYI